ncbi:MAG TPA: hydroxyethylthiazole kinase, partial [Candidatus Choladousia intestinigallinarum]|nr:hydroxyethylthiazole kinase [Candidatus Choladousia intestinigallinarum]
GEQTDIFGKAVYAAAAHGICGELAWERTKEQEGGAGSFRVHFFDAVSMLTDRQIQEGARIEI